MKEEFILNLIDRFEKSPSVFLHIKNGEAELTLKKEEAYRQNIQGLQNPLQYIQTQPVLQQTSITEQVQTPSAVSGLPSSENRVKTESGISGDTSKELVTVKSPIVGSFYRSPSPDAPAYVEKGGKVSKGQPLCILEAMKMMNTLECEYNGIIEDILVANGDLVEFEQPLFVIRIE